VEHPYLETLKKGVLLVATKTGGGLSFNGKRTLQSGWDWAGRKHRALPRDIIEDGGQCGTVWVRGKGRG
jgi:hypothetical protein